ncbi:hypothetical protein B296_00048982 [Ensete ventricosum]|uniref:Uncharacterized protein n=1 Tax=Ensete ventricosum TaxID=4639 RepID=A0A426X9J9_ENSVE|nr:hypothetical protein B296_00048982 [Ensete ventricosum]
MELLCQYESTPLGDFLDLRRLSPLLSRGLGGTPSDTRRLPGSRPLTALPQVHASSVLVYFSAVEAMTSTTRDALVIDGAIDPLSTLLPYFIFLRLNISTRQKGRKKWLRIRIVDAVGAGGDNDYQRCKDKTTEKVGGDHGGTIEDV